MTLHEKERRWVFDWSFPWAISFWSWVHDADDIAAFKRVAFALDLVLGLAKFLLGWG